VKYSKVGTYSDVNHSKTMSSDAKNYYRSKKKKGYKRSKLMQFLLNKSLLNRHRDKKHKSKQYTHHDRSNRSKTE